MFLKFGKQLMSPSVIKDIPHAFPAWGMSLCIKLSGDYSAVKTLQYYPFTINIYLEKKDFSCLRCIC